MSTTAQILANRNNSRKSTGPQTDEGKAVVSQNAVKHGLFAAEAVISIENPGDYELYRNKYLAELLPAGMVESMLAERIVSLSWRLQRAERMHNEAIDVMLAQAETNGWQKSLRNDARQAQDPRAGGLELILGWATEIDFSNSRVLERLLMYERRIENSLDRTIHKLKKYQLMRHIQEADARKPSTSLRDEDATRPNPTFPKDEAATRRAPGYKLDDLKKQSQNRPSSGNLCLRYPKYEARNPKQVERVHLKKQTQFEPGPGGVIPFMEKDYNNSPAGGDEENKPNQACPEHVEWGQFPATEPTEGAGKREKSLEAASG